MDDTSYTVASIAGGASDTSTKIISLLRKRTFKITVQLTYDASASKAARIEVQTSPDNSNWDTIDYLNELADLTVNAGNVVQRTIIIDPPETGFARIKIVNNDSNPITSITVWYSIQSWGRAPGGTA